MRQERVERHEDDARQQEDDRPTSLSVDGDADRHERQRREQRSRHGRVEVPGPG